MYTSPTVEYAGLKFYAEPRLYASPRNGDAMAGSLVLQCRQKPDTFYMQGETMGFARKWGADHIQQAFPHVSPNQLKFLSEVDTGVITYGLLIRTCSHGTESVGWHYRSPVDLTSGWLNAEAQAGARPAKLAQAA